MAGLSTIKIENTSIIYDIALLMKKINRMCRGLFCSCVREQSKMDEKIKFQKIKKKLKNKY